MKPLNGPGAAVDSDGRAAIDPTTNVLSLVEAAVKRIDDLRIAETKRTDDLRLTIIERATELREAESRRLTEQLVLRSEYTEKLSAAEAKRIDAIRAVDVAAVAVAAERASQQANVLATQVATSAETLRTLVASTAAQVAGQLQQVSQQFTERLAALEKAAYTGEGRSRITDPQLDQLANQMRGLIEAQSQGAGRSAGMSSSWGVVVSAVSMLVALASILFVALRHT